MSGHTAAQIPGDTRIAELSEHQLVQRIRATLPQHHHPDVLIGLGDDAAVVQFPNGRNVVATTDMSVEGQDFRRDWSTPNDVGHKVVVQNVADVVAMGGTCTTLLVSLGMPGDTPLWWFDGFQAGLAAGCAQYRTELVGGDLSASPQIVVSVTALGHVSHPVTRGGANVGDRVFISGVIGWSAAGLHILQELTEPGAVDAPARTWWDRDPADRIDGNVDRCDGAASAAWSNAQWSAVRQAVHTHVRPNPDLLAAQHDIASATAGIDLSDGLLRDASRIACASGHRIRLCPLAIDQLARPIAQGLAVSIETARHWVLTSGEEHQLLATWPAHTPPPSGWIEVGVVVSGAPDPAVWLADTALDERIGFDHFQQ